MGINLQEFSSAVAGGETRGRRLRAERTPHGITTRTIAFDGKMPAKTANEGPISAPAHIFGM